MKGLYQQSALNGIISETADSVFGIEVGIYSGTEVQDIFDENATITITKPGTSIKFLARDRDNAGTAGNISQHGPSMKVVKKDGSSVSILLSKDKNGNPNPHLDPHTSNAMAREFRKEINLCVAFAIKNFDDLLELWYNTDPAKAKEIANRIRNNNREFKFSISI